MKPFAIAISEYVGDYLPNMRKVSPNTIRSYCNGLAQFMEFAERELGKDVSVVKPADLTYDLANAYIKHLQERGASESTCAQRMACLKAFMKWLARVDISYLAAREAMCAAMPPRAPDPVIDWLTLDEVRLLLSLPDPSDPAGLRDLAILTVLYDAAARCQELCDLDVGNVNLPAKTVTLYGKGRKTRSVPISREAASIVKKYIGGLERPACNAPLVTGRGGSRITPSGVQYVISKYASKARAADSSSFPGKTITAHVFRHSKAMHMLEAGVEMIYIRDFLGHKSIKTTEIYARANPEAKRAAIEKYTEALGLPAIPIPPEREQNVIDMLRTLSREARRTSRR